MYLDKLEYSKLCCCCWRSPINVLSICAVVPITCLYVYSTAKNYTCSINLCFRKKALLRMLFIPQPFVSESYQIKQRCRLNFKANHGSKFSHIAKPPPPLHTLYLLFTPHHPLGVNGLPRILVLEFVKGSFFSIGFL